MATIEQNPLDGETPRLITRERLAWTVMLLSFLTFVVLATAAFVGGRYYITTASRVQIAAARGTAGKTLLEPAGARDPVAIEAGRLKGDVTEGTTLRTDESSQIELTFFDGSSVTLFPNTTLVLSEMRRTRFRQSTVPDRLVLTLHAGRLRATVAREGEQPLRFAVQTPHALAPDGGVFLSSGSYTIESSNEVTHVLVRQGSARVQSQIGLSVELGADERAEIPLGASPVGPLPAKRNLLANSAFLNPEVAVPISNGPLVERWEAVSSQGGDGGTVDGTVEQLISGTTRALHFERQGSGNNHGETAVFQRLDQQVGDYRSLILRLDVRVAFQSLSGGGVQSSEFPLMVRVDYVDAAGGRNHWTQGFYYQNENSYNILNGVRVPQDFWVTVEIDLKRALNDPSVIEQVQLYASGWDWDAYVRELELIVE